MPFTELCSTESWLDWPKWFWSNVCLNRLSECPALIVIVGQCPGGWMTRIRLQKSAKPSAFSGPHFLQGLRLTILGPFHLRSWRGRNGKFHAPPPHIFFPDKILVSFLIPPPPDCLTVYNITQFNRTAHVIQFNMDLLETYNKPNRAPVQCGGLAQQPTQCHGGVAQQTGIPATN